MHPRRDTRIFYRECVSLFKSGYDVYLLVADGKGDELVEGVQVLDIGLESSRIKNFFKSGSKIRKKVEELKPSLVHFHDPELMFVGKQLSSKFQIPVVFDIHENITVQILDKTYIPKFLRGLVSLVYKKVEQYYLKYFHLIIAEHSYQHVYTNKGRSLTTVLNMPDLRHFEPYINNNRAGNEIFYIGGISNERGLDVTLEALKILKSRGTDFFMHYIGPISEEKIVELPIREIKENVKFYGRMDSKEGFEVSKKCVVGLSVLKPIKNYVESYSTKIFEYMAIGLPVITSNFPLYQKVVERYDCGFCVEPYSSNELADSIEELILNPDLVNQMGENGQRAVNKKYSWASEEEKLLRRYKNLI
ncbi:glycosyltransferase [Maribacter aestuarii]|uniref:glycosyltransferase n=1 Tax=Maribacter aestuarii TaxID=1130723 RepID=UPI00248D374C|nr:glycosyltransferase [Maribacter aestuarii]